MTNWRAYSAVVRGNDPWTVMTYDMFGTPIGEIAFDVVKDMENYIETLQDIEPEFKLVIE